MDITTKSIDELKALGYDQMMTLDITQRNLQAINAEIAKRMAEAKESKPEEKWK